MWGEVLGEVDSERADASCDQPLCTDMGGVKMVALHFVTPFEAIFIFTATDIKAKSRLQ